MFYFFGLGLTFFLLLLLIFKKNKSFAEKVLAAWLFVIGCHLSLYVISFQPLTINNIHRMGLGIPFPFLHGPFLYLYTASLTNQLPRKKLLWLHFLPAALIIVSELPFYLSSAEYKMGVFDNEGRDYALSMQIIAWLMKLSGIIYIIWSFILLRKHKKNIGKLFSYEEKINLNWLRFLIYALSLVWIIIIFFPKDTFIFGAVVISVFFLGFFGIRQVGIFNNSSPIKANLQKEQDDISVEEMDITVDEGTKPDEQFKNSINEFKPTEEADIKVVETETDVATVKKKKYANSGLTAEALNELHQRLVQLMRDEKLYTEPELSLSSLAATLNVHPNYLSQTINEIEGKSFFDYINTLRIEEFKRLMLIRENNQFTIMSLAYDCGFNSKSSFNKNFKKVTGQSPSEYISNLSNKT